MATDLANLALQAGAAYATGGASLAAGGAGGGLAGLAGGGGGGAPLAPDQIDVSTGPISFMVGRGAGGKSSLPDWFFPAALIAAAAIALVFVLRR